MGVLSRQLYEASNVLGRRALSKAPEQAGIFAGVNPASYNTNDPIQLWIIQLIIIMAMTQLLAILLKPIRQPRVISEVIGGVILGPSIMGRIPNFSNRIFPVLSLPMINLTSTIGIILFLFLVGLEIDTRIVKRHFKASFSISAAGLIIPLGLGAALGVPIYHQFVSPEVKFGYFLLFTAVAVGITAFPVLCRILTELNLLDDTVGAVTLAAGVGNDVVGWILLALTVALVNSGNGITALWVLLTAVGYTIFLLVPVRWGYRWLARRTGSFDNGTPTTTMMSVTLVIVFISAFFTDIIGIHPIFGGFLAGLIIPHENGYAIALVEKLEDLVSLLFIPLYFALTGLKTNLGLLNNGITWGYTVLICVVAFFSKFLACGITAKLAGFNWRESGAVGSLMSCKGLVELIVLNVGLSAGILDTRTFSMLVLHALVLTFMTTPLTLLFYPEKYRNRLGAVCDKPRGAIAPTEQSQKGGIFQESFKTEFSVVLEKVEQLPAAMTLTQLLQQPNSSSSAVKSSIRSTIESEKGKKEAETAVPPGLSYAKPATAASGAISIDALRLIELTNRTSAMLKSQFADSLIHSDPVLSVFRTFGQLNHMVVSTALAIVGYDDFPSYIADHVKRTSSQMLILPWVNVTPVEVVDGADGPSSSSPVFNAFDSFFVQKTDKDQNISAIQTQLLRKTFMASPVDVALFIDRGLSQSVDATGGQHIFLPFFGGPDDRMALSFVVQLCRTPSTTATIVRYTKTDSALSPVDSIEETKKLQPVHNSVSVVLNDTIYDFRDTQTRLASESADNILWERYTSSVIPEIADALSRISFTQEVASLPLHSVLDLASQTVKQRPDRRHIIAVGRSRRMVVESHAVELSQILTETGSSWNAESTKTLGEVASGFVASNVNASLLILQAASA